MKDTMEKCLVNLLEDYAVDGDTDVYGAVRDVLTDIKHYCDRHNIDFDEAVQRAKTVAAEEVQKFKVDTVENRVYHTSYLVDASSEEDARNKVAEGEGDELRDEFVCTDKREIGAIKKVDAQGLER